MNENKNKKRSIKKMCKMSISDQVPNGHRGITLIALVITIIVLLILAAVSIATLTGENGILKQVGNAKVQNTKGAEKEQVGLAYTALKMSKEGNDITAQELEDELNKTLGDEKTKVTGSNTLKIEFSDTKNVYTISNDGSVEEYKKAEVTPVYAFLCDTNNDGTGETLVLSSTDSIDGYTIINNYGDNEAYQTNEDNVEESWGSYYY